MCNANYDAYCTLVSEKKNGIVIIRRKFSLREGHWLENITDAIPYWLSNLLVIIQFVPSTNKVLWGYTYVRITNGSLYNLSIHLFYSCNLIWTIFCSNGELFEILTSYSDCFWPQCDLNLKSFGQSHWKCVKSE